MPDNLSILDFARVDEADDPQRFVGYLDSVRRALQPFKTLAFDALALSHGDALLEVGCGTGDDTRRLAELVGERGRAIGVDNSDTMIEEARRRAVGSGLPVEFRVDDAQRLTFPDATFDATRAERVFQHLADPVRALRELARVTRPGGRVVIGPEPDWETLVVDCSDDEVMRRIKAVHCGLLTSAGIAHELPAHMRRLSLESVGVTPGTIVLADFGAADAMLALTGMAECAHAAGAISSRERSIWIDDLRTRDATGDFFLALTGFVTSAEKPSAAPD
jgi:SAM-dependent methyltransferase